METVRIKEEHEFPAEVRKGFELVKEWFNIDYVPKMSRALAFYPEMRFNFSRASKRACSPGELARTQKELIAVAVSAVNVCRY